MFNCRRAFILAVFLSILTSSSRVFAALDTIEIEKVTKKAVLDKQDLAVIEQFVGAGVEAIVTAENLSAVGSIRNTILAYNHSSQASADGQYKPQFLAAAQKSVAKALSDAKGINEPNRQAAVVLNLMILVDNLHDPALLDTAIAYLNDNNTSIRYWAVHAITSPGLYEQIKGKNSTVESIIEKLAGLLKTETSPEIMEVIARFAGNVNNPSAQGLLISMADARMKHYESWNVDYIPLDGTILRLLSEKITPGTATPAAVRFAQLFSYAMQYYYKNKDLPAWQKEQLSAMLIATESKALAKLGIIQTGVKRGIEKNTLAAECKALFGEGAVAGKFGGVVPVDFGQDANGVKRLTPAVLPDKPRAEPVGAAAKKQ